MRSLLILLVFCATTAAADDWWEKSEYSLPDLVSMGYEVIGFTVGDQPASGMLDGGRKVVYRYLLQREFMDTNKPNNIGVHLMLCTEVKNSSGTRRNCYSMADSKIS